MTSLSSERRKASTSSSVTGARPRSTVGRANLEQAVPAIDDARAELPRAVTPDRRVLRVVERSGAHVGRGPDVHDGERPRGWVENVRLTRDPATC